MAARTDQVRSASTRTALAEARLGQAYFSRKLNELDDDELFGPSPASDRTRAHIVSAVSYHARAMTRLVDWALTGERVDEHESARARDHEVEFGATLAARALRHLSEHAGITLDVAWRDLPDERWAFEVEDLDGHRFGIEQTVQRHADVLWRGALDFGNGGRWIDLPPSVRDRLGAGSVVASG